jgi:hypothetical protein
VDGTLSPLNARLFEVRGQCVAPPVNPLTQRPRAGTALLDAVVPRPTDGYHRHHVCGNRTCLNADHVVVVSPSFHRQLHRPDPVGVRGVER